MGLLGDVGDPVKDVAAIKPLADHLVDRALTEGKDALVKALVEALDGLTITITKKPPTPGQ